MRLLVLAKTDFPFSRTWKIVGRLLAFLTACAVLLGGGIAQGATFGKTTTGTLWLSLENNIVGAFGNTTDTWTPASNGTVDSITAHIRAVGNDPPVTYNCRCALYKYDSARVAPNLTVHGPVLDSTAVFTIPSDIGNIDAWISNPTIIDVAVTAGTVYIPVCWSKSGVGATQMSYAVGTDSITADSRTWTTNAWETPGVLTYSNALVASIYVTYTPTGGVKGRLLIEKKRNSYSMARQAMERFAGRYDDLEL